MIGREGGESEVAARARLSCCLRGRALVVGVRWVCDASVKCGDLSGSPGTVGVTQLLSICKPIAVTILFAQCFSPLQSRYGLGVAYLISREYVRDIKRQQ